MFTRGYNTFRFSSPEHFVEFFETRYGPMVKARERLASEGAGTRAVARSWRWPSTATRPSTTAS